MQLSQGESGGLWFVIISCEIAPNSINETNIQKEVARTLSGKSLKGKNWSPGRDSVIVICITQTTVAPHGVSLTVSFRRLFTDSCKRQKEEGSCYDDSCEGSSVPVVMRTVNQKSVAVMMVLPLVPILLIWRPMRKVNMRRSRGALMKCMHNVRKVCHYEEVEGESKRLVKRSQEIARHHVKLEKQQEEIERHHLEIACLTK